MARLYVTHSSHFEVGCKYQLKLRLIIYGLISGIALKYTAEIQQFIKMPWASNLYVTYPIHKAKPQRRFGVSKSR